MQSTKKEVLLLSLEPTLKKRIQEDAEKNDRTANSEITHILKEYYKHNGGY